MAEDDRVPTLVHIACVKILIPFWTDPSVKKIFKVCFNERRRVCNPRYLADRDEHPNQLDIIGQVLVLMEDLFQNVPNPVGIELMKAAFIMNTELFNWLTANNKLYNGKMSRYFFDMNFFDFVDHLGCVKWTSFGFINYKRTAKALCNCSEMAGLLKFVIMCTHLPKEPHNISSYVLSSLLRLMNLDQFLNEFPMVSLFVSRLGPYFEHRQQYTPLNHTVFEMLMQQLESVNVDGSLMTSPYDVPLRFLWSRLNREEELRCFHDTLTNHKNLPMSILMNVKTTVINFDCRNCALGVMSVVLHNLWYTEGRFSLYECAVPNLSGTDIVYLVRCIKDLRSTDERRLIHVVRFLKERNSVKAECYLGQFRNYMVEKYTNVLKELFEYVPSCIKNELVADETLEFVRLFANLLGSLLHKYNYHTILSILNGFSETDRDEILNFDSVLMQFGRLVGVPDQENNALLVKLVREALNDEDKVKKYKAESFFVAFKYEAAHSIHNGVEEFIAKMESFVNNFTDVMSPDRIIEQKKAAFKSKRVFRSLIRYCFSVTTLKLDGDKMNKFFKWFHDLTDDESVDAFKVNYFFEEFQIERESLRLETFVGLTPDGQETCMNEIQRWCTNDTDANN